MTILYIEDDPINAMIISKFLENDFSVEVASTSEESLRLLSKNTYDLILLDLNLGHDNENGLSLFYKIQKLSGCDKIPVIALTASSDPHERDSYLNAGFYGFIVKPVERISLINYLKGIKENARVE
ncbi:MAG: response regulator [Bacteroidetes bacterium]|nr:MAG: response regulator [Bacteroidota bacterium]